MKRLTTILAALLIAAATHAMSYDQARERALFLADKMAYELNLTDEQYEACYEVNLDYFMSIGSSDDLYGDYWARRNLDLSYILLDWQYDYFLSAAYFYRPFYFLDNVWHFAIYTRYPHRDYFFFGRPAFWTTYRGGHAWHKNGNKSWYSGRTFVKKGAGVSNRGSVANGMRDRFNKGDYGRGQTFNNGKNSGRVTSGGNSSTRVTVGNGPSGTKPAVSTRRNNTTFNNTAAKQNATTNKPSTTSRPTSTSKPSSTTSRPTSTSKPSSTTSRPSTTSTRVSTARPSTSRSTGTASRSSSTSRPASSSSRSSGASHGKR